jgi:hypothetical protein
MGTLDNVIAKEKMLASPSNYKVWRTTVRNVFEKEDLWDCIEPIEEEENGSGGEMDEVDEEAPRQQQPNCEEIRRERRRKTIALGVLRLTLTEGVQDIIEHITDPREAWLELQRLYQTKTIADMMLLRSKWQEARMTETMDVASFRQLIYGILKEFCDTDQTLDEATMVPKFRLTFLIDLNLSLDSFRMRGICLP